MKTLLTTSLLCLIGTAALAASPFYTLTDTATDAPAGYGDFGINFTVNSAVNVTELSFLRFNMGASEIGNVQLWNVSTNTSLAIASFDGATGDGWKTEALLASVTLNTSDTYQLQSIAYFANRYDQVDFAFDSIVASTSYAHDGGWAGSWGPKEAASTGATTAPYAAIANLTFAPVPEPSSYALLGGICALGYVMTRRRK